MARQFLPSAPQSRSMPCDRPAGAGILKRQYAAVLATPASLSSATHNRLAAHHQSPNSSTPTTGPAHVPRGACRSPRTRRWTQPDAEDAMRVAHSAYRSAIVTEASDQGLQLREFKSGGFAKRLTKLTKKNRLQAAAQVNYALVSDNKTSGGDWPHTSEARLTMLARQKATLSSSKE
jgi:hypothetical protein